MLTTLAWRNIWRSRTRSLVVILAITIGIFSLIFMLGFYNGMSDAMADSTIQNQVSHIQIHNPTFNKEKESKYFLNDVPSALENIKSKDGVNAVSSRTLANGMISTSRASKGVTIRGINPEMEKEVTKFDKMLSLGRYFESRRNPILISKKLAEELKIEIDTSAKKVRRPKVILQFQDITGNITAASFRVDGFYDTGNNQVDDVNVFVRQEDLQSLLGLEETQSNEIAILLEDKELTDTVQTLLKADYDDLAVESYKEISPMLNLLESQMDVTSTIITAIFMIALIFGIINTMLMAILERVKEIGMLMAIGMNKLRVFSLVVIETIMLCIIGAPFGILLGHLVLKGMSKNGLDLSAYSEGMREYGISEVVYPSLDPSFYITVATAIVITAILGSLYPALKAIRLKPVEALRKI